MKTKFGVITFEASQLKSEEIVLRPPNFSNLENTLRESRKKIELGKEAITGFIVTAIALVAAGFYVRQLKPIPVKTTKQSLK